MKAMAAVPTHRLQALQVALPRPEGIPRLAPAAAERPSVAEAGVPGTAQEPVRAPEARQGEARPTPARAERLSPPSLELLEAAPGALASREEQEAVAGAWTAAAEAHPRSGRPAESVPAARRLVAHPTWGLHPELVRQALVRQGQGPKASPRWPGLISRAGTRVDPSSAMSPGERRQLERPGSARARRPAAPRSLRCQDATDSRQPEVAERTGGPAERPFGACVAGA
jgi:hypothetical protein